MENEDTFDKPQANKNTQAVGAVVKQGGIRSSLTEKMKKLENSSKDFEDLRNETRRRNNQFKKDAKKGIKHIDFRGAPYEPPTRSR